MKKFKKIVATMMTAAIAGTSFAMLPTGSVSAANITFLQGDVNGDGTISSTDLVYLNNYLSGNNAPDVNVLTRMDAFQNKLIDKQDYNKILNCYLGSDTPQTITTSTLTNVNNIARRYYKHDCDSDSQSSYSFYDLHVPSDVATADFTPEDLVAPNEYIDDENLNVVKLSYTTVNDEGETVTNLGSGFIVGDNVVATAGHCLYGNDKFFDDMVVKVYNEDCTQVLNTFEAESLHIPATFANISDDNRRNNYDYGLIVVEPATVTEDGVERTVNIGDYGKWSLGCITNEFMATGAELITSGFTYCGNYELECSRYYSSGAIVDNSNIEIKNIYDITELRLETYANAFPGKSGGVVYYESVYNNRPIKTAVGIAVGGGDEGGYTWGTRITPTVARFYMNNPNL